MLAVDDLPAVADRPLDRSNAALLLAEIDSYCARTGMLPSQLGALAVNFGGYVGLMRLRGTARTRLAIVVRDFMSSWPEGCPAAAQSEQRVRAKALMARLRSRADAPMKPRRTSDLPRREAAGIATPMQTPPILAVDREGCFRCGVRGDIGCEHRRAFSYV